MCGLVGRRIEALASRNGSARRIFIFAPFVILTAIITLAPAKAQVAVTGAPTAWYNYSGDTINLLSPTPVGQHSLNDKPVRDYQGLPLEGWVLYPSMFLGAVFDDNLYQMSTNRVSGAGLNLRPSFLAERDAGIHRTSIYANGSFNFYPDNSDANTTNAQAGFAHTWEATRDLVFKAGAEYGRHTDVFNNGIVTGSIAGSSGVSGLIAVPLTYNTLSGYVSGLQSFDKFFVGLSASSIAASYDPLNTTSGQISQTFRNNVVTTVTGVLATPFRPPYTASRRRQGISMISAATSLTVCSRPTCRAQARFIIREAIASSAVWAPIGSASFVVKSTPATSNRCMPPPCLERREARSMEARSSGIRSGAGRSPSPWTRPTRILA